MLKSGATQEEKAAACRQLARVATKQSVPTLASLLGDEKLSHMARYAMETIPDPSVDEALRDALGKLKGRPLLGVIGSLGVRRDAKAVDAIAKLLAGSRRRRRPRLPHAPWATSARPRPPRPSMRALTGASGANQLAICEGLFRCAEALPARGARAASRRRSTTVCAG